MLNIVELERRWLHYKIKSYLPYVIILLSTIVIAIVIFTFISQDSKVNNLINPKVKEPIIVIQEKTTIPKEQIVIQVETPKKEILPEKQLVIEQKVLETPKVQLSPSLDFMKKMQNSVQPYYRTEVETTEEKVSTPSVEIVDSTQQEVEIVEEVEPVIQVKHQKITIKRQNTQNDIYEIIQRFKKNNNPALSLFVAKKYYELADYEQAYNYSLITNDINENIESSWIIFSKSLVKLGKKEKATAILKKYISQSHSNSAKILLDEIRSGKFR